MKNGPYTLKIAPKEYPGKKYRDRYVYEHHLVWWQTYGKLPPDKYEIHHIDEDHRNNSINNLLLVTREEHRRIHVAIRGLAEKRIKSNCGFCGKAIERTTADYRYKMRTNKSKKLFCSQRCGAKHQFQFRNP